DRRVQLRPIGPIEDARVMTGGELLEAQLDDAREHQVEPHERVAADAGVRRPAFEVVAVKWLDDALAELRLQVPAVIRNVEKARDPASVLDRVERAAPAVARRLLAVIAGPLLQGDADDLVTL